MLRITHPSGSLAHASKKLPGSAPSRRSRNLDRDQSRFRADERRAGRCDELHHHANPGLRSPSARLPGATVSQPLRGYPPPARASVAISDMKGDIGATSRSASQEETLAGSAMPGVLRMRASTSNAQP